MDIYSKLENASKAGGTLTVINHDGESSLAWADLFSEAEKHAGWMQARGIGPGSVVMTAARTSKGHIVAILAAWITGAAITVTAVPMRSRRSTALRDRFLRLRKLINPTLILGDEDHLATLTVAHDDKIMSIDEWNILASGPERSVFNRMDNQTVPDDVAIMQATSGTTGFPKVAPIPYRCLDANHRAIVDGIELRAAEDTVLSWLPLSHDMGLIGLMGTPMITGANLVIADPSLFAAEPGNWMRWCADHRATVTGGPSFAYGIAASMMKRRAPADLSNLRLAMNGAEPIDVDTCREFVAAGQNCGLTPDAMFAVYGLAEATLAVTFPTLLAGLESDLVDRQLLGEGMAVTTRDGGKEKTRLLAKLGYPLKGVDVKISSVDGRALSDREVGRVLIRGSSVIAGYLGHPPFDSEWFDTGDLGYLADRQLVVCGRDKDLIVIAGRNIYPEEIERALGAIDGVWRGNVAVFSTTRRGREAVVITAEVQDSADHILASRLAAVASDWCDARVADVHLIEPGSIPKTPSGKISRSACRTDYELNRQ